MDTKSARLTLSALLLVAGCALFGHKDSATDKWQQDAKASVREGTPERERELAEFVAQQNERITEMQVQIAKSTDALADNLLGTTAWPGLPPSTFEAQTRVLTQHVSFPKLRPFEDRKLNAFFVDMSAADQAKINKLAKNRDQLTKVTQSLTWLQAAGYTILLEQNRAVALDWGAELMALYLGSKVIAFEKQTETKASEETLKQIAVAVANRDQARALLLTHTAALAAFEGVSQGGDPKSIGVLATAMKAQASAQPEVSTEAARAFLDGIQGEALDVAASLEAGMRAAVGDKSYENAYQSGLVQTLQQIEEAQAEESLYDVIDQQAKQAKQIEMKQLRDTAQQRLVARAKELGLEKAKGFLSMLPGGKQLLAGLNAIKELRAGNPRGALMAALEAAPAGPVSEGLKTASKVAFAVADHAKRKR